MYCVVQVTGWLVKTLQALRHKPVGGGFDSRWRHYNVALTQSFRQEYFVKVKVAGA
jgi:hypothetical protein